MFTRKLGRRHRNFLYNLWSSIPERQCLPLSTSPIRVVHLFTTDGPTLTYYYPLKSIIYFRVHLWYCTFCGFGKMCNDMYSPLYYAEYFDCLKNPLCLTYLSLSLQLWHTPLMLFTISLVLPFPEVIQLESYSNIAFSNYFFHFSSVQFSLSVVSDSLRPHESQHARPPCPSPTPGVYSNSCPSSR